MSLELDKIIQHDVVKPFPLSDECIDVIFTSPPYWGLRDYVIKSIFGGDPKCKHVFTEYHSKLTHENRQNLDGGTIGNDKFREKLHGFGTAKAGFCSKCGAWKGQLGLEPNPQMYIDHLVLICREIKRVLKKSGSFYLNLGDTYGTHTSKRTGQFGKEIKEGFDDIFTQKRTKIGFSDNFIMEKNLLMIPSRVAIALQDDGWILRNDIIWHKPNPMPSSAKDRLKNTFDHVFHFVKSRKYFYDLDAIREPHQSRASGNKQRKLRDPMLHHGHLGSSVPWEPTEVGKNPGDIVSTTDFIPLKEYCLSEYEKTEKRRNAYRHKRGQSTPQSFKSVSEWNKGTRETMNAIINSLEISENIKSQLRSWWHDKQGHPKGKNPGDVVEYNLSKECGLPIIGPKARSNLPSQHQHRDGNPIDNNPKGKNPGDIIKIGMYHGISLTKGRATHYEGQLIEKHPDGKNPGDIIQFDEEYWWNFILGKAHSNKFYKKAYELMKDWMIKNNCFDYNIFYEWYREEFKGKWESGTLKKGKATYLSDEKRLPFPKPETRFLGDMPSDFWKTNPEYIIGTLAKKIRDFYDAHPDADLGWLDDIIRDIVLANPDDFIYSSDFWSLTTQPFTGYNPDLEHFAVFPEGLVLKPLKASCPKEICKKCGEPRIRIVEKKTTYESRSGRSGNRPKGKYVDKEGTGIIGKKLRMGPTPHVKTVGWTDCGCNADFDAGVVLDPFCGRGTVGKVAKSLGLHYILFDAKPEYCELARLFIGGQKYKLAKDQSRLDV